MRVLRMLIAVLGAASLMLMGTVQVAQAAKPAPSENHGQCVSSSPKPDGKGGRSGAAQKDNGTCPAPPECVTNGQVSIDSDANTAAVTVVPGGSSVECETNYAVTAGQTVSFEVDYSDGASCNGGAPRLYFEVNGNGYNTFDGNPDQCGGEDGVITMTIPETGNVTAVYLVYDFNEGTATFSNVLIGEHALDL